MYQVYDNGRLADLTNSGNQDSIWQHPVCETFEQALQYAEQWLGDLAGINLKPNVPVDYSGYGDMIEIRKIEE